MKSIRYKDSLVNTNTHLYALIEAGETKKSEEHNKKLEAEFFKHFPKDVWNKVKGVFHGNVVKSD